MTAAALAFLGWQLLVTRAERISEVSPAVVTPTATAQATYTPTATALPPTSTPVPPSPTPTPSVGEPARQGVRLEVVGQLSAVDQPLTVRLHLNTEPDPKASYWAMRTDVTRDDPNRALPNPPMYPQGPAAVRVTERFIELSLSLPIADRVYDIRFWECDDAGHRVIQDVVDTDKQLQRYETPIYEKPPGCTEIFRRDMQVSPKGS
jgi:hypothetical protein